MRRPIIWLIIVTLAALLTPFATQAAPTRACWPGTVQTLRGTGPVSTPLLLAFDGSPVGGSTTDSNGSYSIPLAIDRGQRPGVYAVAILVRSTRQRLAEMTCVVPAPATPSPISAPTQVSPTSQPTTAPTSTSLTPTTDAINHAGVPPSNTTTCPPDYPIKGNHSSSGELIYHTRSSRSYDRTFPEQCFALEADAEAAGYRAARD